MNNQLTIRPETPSDYEAIRGILIAAFANHPYSRQTEHLIVEALRAANAQTLALVAELDGKVVGHIAFSPIKIDQKDTRWLGLGPIAVQPEFQRQGIGKALVNEGLKQIRDRGAEGCILVGDPNYYNRFGFKNRPELVFEGIPQQFFMCLPFTDKIPTGAVTNHPAFSAGL